MCLNFNLIFKEKQIRHHRKRREMASLVTPGPCQRPIMSPLSAGGAGRAPLTPEQLANLGPEVLRKRQEALSRGKGLKLARGALDSEKMVHERLARSHRNFCTYAGTWIAYSRILTDVFEFLSIDATYSHQHITFLRRWHLSSSSTAAITARPRYVRGLEGPEALKVA